MIGRRIRAFSAFWYDFVIGDDWIVALGVVLAFTVTYVITHVTYTSAWWVVPVSLVVLLPWSIRRAVRPRR